MQKKLRRLRLDRETVRTLTPENLEAAAGGGIDNPIESRVNSCDPAASTRIRTACTASIFIFVSGCDC